MRSPNWPLSPERLCLLIAVALIVAYTLAPFALSASGTEMSNRIREGLAIASLFGALKLAGHLLAFFILGGMIAAVYQRSIATRGFTFLAVTTALFCAGLEFAQLLQETRHARLADLMANFTGTLLGAKTAVSWGPARYTRAILRKRLRRYPVRFQTGIFILATGTWCFAAFQPVLGSLKIDWNDDYRLILANEADGSRPWLGEIRYVGIYGRALSPAQVSSTYDIRDKRKKSEASFNETALLAGYDFTCGPANEVAPAGLLRSERLTIQIPASCDWKKDGTGVLAKQNTLLLGQTAVSALTTAIKASGAFSIEAWIRPLDDTQKGPARIISYSSGIWRRNFALGQQADDMVFRVRNRINGPNGSEHALKIKGVVRSEWQHWVAVYDHGVSSLFRDGQLLTPTVDLREPPVYLGLGTHTAGRAVAGAFLVLTLALPAYSMFSLLPSRLMRHLAAVLLAFCVGSLPYVAVCLFVGGPWRADFFLSFAIVLIVIYPLCFLYVHRLPQKSRDGLPRGVPVMPSMRELSLTQLVKTRYYEI
jgi:hypothetical protein